MTTLQSPRRYSVKSASCAQLWLVRRYLDRVIWLARRYHDNGWPPVLHNTERQGSKHKMHILVQLTFLWNALRHWTIPRCQVKLWHADSFWPCYSPLCTCHDSRAQGRSCLVSQDIGCKSDCIVGHLEKISESERSSQYPLSLKSHLLHKIIWLS